MKKSNLLTLFLCLLISPAQAGITIDVADMSSEVVDAVKESLDQAAENVKSAAEQVQAKIIGNKAYVFYEKVKGVNGSIRDARQAAEEFVTTGRTAYETAEKDIEEITSYYESQRKNLQDSQLGQIAQMKEDMANIENQMNDRRQALDQEMENKTRSAQENLEIMRNMYSSAVEGNADPGTLQILEQQLSSAQKEYDGLQAQNQQRQSGDDFYMQDLDYRSLTERRDNISHQLEEMGSSALGGLMSLTKAQIGSLLKKSPEQKLSEYKEVLELNFLKEDADINEENIKDIEKYRKEVLVNDVAHALTMAAQNKVGMTDKEEKADINAGNVTAAEFRTTSANFLIEQRIQEIKALHEFTSLLIADLRLKTSRNMINQDYHLKDYEKNPSILNLDNYAKGIKGSFMWRKAHKESKEGD